MNNKKINVFNVFFSRILNRFNFNKFLTILVLGFISRVFVGHFYKDIYLDFLNIVSISSYVCISAFIIIVYEFVYYFDFKIIPYFKFSILKECIKRFYINGLDNKLYMDSNVHEIKPSRETKFYNKGSYNTRPFKSSPLSNPPITPANINEMKPAREIKFRNKPSNSLRPTTFQKPSAFTEKDKDFTGYIDEFKEFYTTYRESIKLSNSELEILSVKMAIENDKGNDGWDILPEYLKPIYKDFLRKKYVIQRTNSNS